MFKTKDQFLFLTAAAVVIIASFVIISRRMVEPAPVEASQDSVQMMLQLMETVDDGGSGELEKLEMESSGL